MDVIELIGRIMFALLFVVSGVRHFTKRPMMVEYSRASGGPVPEVGVPLTGLMLLAGGVLVALGVWGDLGALLIAASLVPIAYFMHAFWKVEDPEMRAMQEAHFMKNLSLAGAALVLLYLFQHFGDAVQLTVGKPLF